MATSSIDQEFIISDTDAAEKLVEAIESGRRLPVSDRMSDEEEEKALEQFLSHHTSPSA